MKTFTSFKDLGNLDLTNVSTVKIKNEVSESEIIEYQKSISRKANGFIRRYNGSKKLNTNEESALFNIGWSQKDIEQELLIYTWQLLVNYDPAKSYGPNGYCKKETFILDCLDNKLGMLNKKMWAKKRGFDCPHEYDSIVINGEYSKEDE
jgi:hypothetical protein